MKKTLTNIMISLLASILLCSCAIIQEAVTAVSNTGLKYLDNTQTLDNWKQDEDLKGLVTLMQASNSGDGGMALAGAKVAADFIGAMGGLKMDKFDQLMDNSMNNMIADKHSNSNNEMNVVGSAVHALVEAANLIEDAKIAKDTRDLSKFEENSRDPNSPKYDPNFDCKYEIIDCGEGKYGSVKKCLRNKSTAEMLWCLRQQGQSQTGDSFSNFMKESYGVDMTYEEYASLPDDERPDIKEYILPSKKNTDANQQHIETNNENSIESYKDSTYDTTNKTNIITTDNAVINSPEQLESIRIGEFKFNSYQLSTDNIEKLNVAADILLKNQDIKIELLGHCCDIGDEQTNYTIGIIRAKTAKQYLMDKGVGAGRISVHSMGSKQPLFPNTSAINRAKNRWVEIKIIK